MGYKLLGFVVWQGAKILARRRLKGPKLKVALAGLGAAVVGGLIVVQRQQSSD
jgi:hypothetical protein